MRTLPLSFAICVIFGVIWAAAGRACLAATWYVDVHGSDSNAGTKSKPFATLYKAVSVVNPGDCVDVDGGTYPLRSEPAGKGAGIIAARGGTRQAPIVIQGKRGQTTVIDAGGLSGTGEGIIIKGEYVTVRNLTVRDAGSYDILILGDHDTIESCTTTGGACGGPAIGGWETKVQVRDDRIIDCIVHDTVTQNEANPGSGAWGSALDCKNCDGALIEGNVVYHNWGEGIDLCPDDYPGNDTGCFTRHVTIKDNTVYDNFSVEIYLNCTQGDLVANNLVYADSNAIRRFDAPAAGIEIDNEMAKPVCADCQIVNNIVIGGRIAFGYFNQHSWSGFFPGGMNGFGIYNNVFYGGSDGCVSISNDPGNNFTWANNITWQTHPGTPVASDDGGGSQVLETNCWVGTGANNMNRAGDVVLSNNAPGFVASGGLRPSDWRLKPTSPCYARGTNASSVFTFDFANRRRPSSGPWTIGAFAADAAD